MKTRIHFLCLSIAAIALAGCAVLPTAVQQDVYQLPPSAMAPHAERADAPALRISRPTANGMLRSARILVMHGPNTLSAYADVRWNSPPAVLLRDHLLDAFHNDGRIHRLSSDADGLQAPYELGGTLRAFQLNYTKETPRVEIRLDARLVDTAAQRIVSARRFTAGAAADSGQLPDVVDAFGRAADALARELIDWAVPQIVSGAPAISQKDENSGR